jgi:hypothetical protein
VSDRKPPRVAADETTTLLTLLDYQRASLRRKLEGVSDDDLNRVIVDSGTTLAWLVAHLARAEVIWVFERFAGEPGPQVDAATTTAALHSYERVARAVDDLVRAHDLDEHCAQADYADTPLRWVVMHLLEETARHAGHADIIRELLDGSTGR